MEMRIRTFLDDKINTLNRNAVDTSPARQIFRTASAILALIRVSALALVSFVDSDWRPNQDTGVDDEDSVQLSEYCFNVCAALQIAVQGKNVDDLNESVRAALGGLERCVD